MTPERTLALLVEALRTFPMTGLEHSERMVQDALERGLVAAGFAVLRELPLSERDRADFVVSTGDGAMSGGMIPVEVKIKGSVSEVDRQITRYAQLPSVMAVILLSTRMQHGGLASRCNGKPVHVIIRAEQAFT